VIAIYGMDASPDFVGISMAGVLVSARSNFPVILRRCEATTKDPSVNSQSTSLDVSLAFGGIRMTVVW
jgi:hypothetical protein